VAGGAIAPDGARTEKSQLTGGAPPDFPFADRRQAGQVLGSKLAHYAGRPDVLVLALPRGGVPVACEVAATLGADWKQARRKLRLSERYSRQARFPI
jgi:hypothetical protein